MKGNKAAASQKSAPRIKLSEGGSISLDSSDDLTLGDFQRLIDYAIARGFSNESTVLVFRNTSLLSRQVNVLVSEKRGGREW